MPGFVPASFGLHYPAETAAAAGRRKAAEEESQAAAPAAASASAPKKRRRAAMDAESWDYRGAVVLAPMVRVGTLPMRRLAWEC
eukprot:SAG22_NODE_8093_length_684_cov_0.415385_2_plen_83_part_01